VKPLTIEGCDEIAAKNTHTLKFPGHGVSVTVRKLELPELEQIALATPLAMAQHGGDNEAANKEVEVLMCSLAIVDANEQQTHNSEAGRAAIAKLPDGMRKKLATTIAGLVGCDGIDAKNS
jgi:hypothetical protein